MATHLGTDDESVWQQRRLGPAAQAFVRNYEKALASVDLGLAARPMYRFLR